MANWTYLWSLRFVYIVVYKAEKLQCADLVKGGTYFDLILSDTGLAFQKLELPSSMLLR